MLPAAGIVRIHAHTMRSITPSRSARGFLAKPTPMIAVEMLWVVDTGMPKWAASVRMVAERVSADKDRKRGVKGKRGSGRVDFGVGRLVEKKKNKRT